MMDASEVYREPIKLYGDWKPWFAKHPVKLMNGKRVWLKDIYRREKVNWAFTLESPRYQYTDLFGVLKNDRET